MFLRRMCLYRKHHNLVESLLVILIDPKQIAYCMLWLHLLIKTFCVMSYYNRKYNRNHSRGEGCSRCKTQVDDNEQDAANTAININTLAPRGEGVTVTLSKFQAAAPLFSVQYASKTDTSTKHNDRTPSDFGCANFQSIMPIF